MRLYFIITFNLILTVVIGQNEKILKYSDLDTIGKIRINSAIYSQIPYDSSLALNDIKYGKIRIIDLICGDGINTNGEIKIIEDRLGFEFYYDCLQLPYKYLIEKQEDYNKVVYNYLDSINGLDSKQEIKDEMRRMFYERTLTANRNDRYLKKNSEKY